MASTPILPFAVWAAGTNQNRIPANDNSLRNQILNGNVISQSTTAQPGSPADGDIYIIASTHTGTQWATFTPNDLAIYSGGTWYAYAPVSGIVVNVAGTLKAWNGSAWTAVGGSSITTDNDTTLSGDSSVNVPTQHAVKVYVDSAVQGLSWKSAVRAATTANGTLSTAFANGQVIDGVTLATGNRILIKNQTTASENGIYTVNASGAPTRAVDADAGAELVNASVYISEGTTLADTQWTCTTNAPITVGSTSLAFAQLTSGGSVAWGAVTGTLSSQTDLQSALDAKQPLAPRVQSVSSASTVTPTFLNDAVKITAQAAALTLANPTGTAVDMAGMVIRIKDNGTARAITFGTQYRAIGVTLPTTTVVSKTLYLSMVYNTEDTKWDVVAVGQE